MGEGDSMHRIKLSLVVALLLAAVVATPASAGVKHAYTHAYYTVKHRISAKRAGPNLRRAGAPPAKLRKELRRLRRVVYRFMHSWEGQQAMLSPATKAMLARLRGCETRGISYPANYRYQGAHDGAYQYDVATWHQAGGSGRASWASPAEQDVRTARFFPSHRSQWACSA